MTIWDQVAEDFEPDGALRDIYVLQASSAEWQQLLDWVRASQRFDFFVDGARSQLPADVGEIFERRKDAAPLLTVWLAEAAANCHFFSDREIELDILPNAFGPENVEKLVSFLQNIGKLLNREVLLTHENMREAIILRYDPAAEEVLYVPLS
jgi:hypothetical protein